MAKAKTKKKEEIIDLSKPKKITEEQLKEVQTTINDINKSQLEIGSMETRKHNLLHQISLLQEKIGEMQIKFESEYGTSDINIQDGTINYPKENGEVNKKN